MSATALFAPRPAQTLARVAIGLGLLAASCAEQKGDAPVESATAALTAAAVATSPGDLDVLFMIDNSSSMTSMQQKLGSQIPAFITALQSLPLGLPNIHIAVVSSDLGAPGDSTTSIQCTPAGDQGMFQTGPISYTGLGGAGGAPDGGGTDAGSGGCSGARLNAGATFISNVDGTTNYTGDLSQLLSCMTQLGDRGCGFEHQLASVARALGADGSPAPSLNSGFLRPGAELAIIVLTNEDDCSAPSDTKLYSLNGALQNIHNPLGPIANYRCNQFGHLCVDPAAGGAACLMQPPLTPPADAQVNSATAPTLSLTDCQSDDSNGLLTPVGSLVDGIRALKADPNNQIVVGAITAPAAPYTVVWVPESGGQETTPGELWPEVEHSCGPAGDDDVNPTGQTSTDGSFGDPAVRVAQWVTAFGDNGVTSSICDGSYANAFSAIVSKIGAHLPGGSAADGGGAGAAGSSGSSALPICPGGITNPEGGEGLKNGGCGCDVTAAGPSALGLLLVLLAVARRRRRASAR